MMTRKDKGRRKSKITKLTKKIIDDLQPESRYYFVHDIVPGFSVKILTNGRKVYVYKWRTIADTHAISLDDARAFCVNAQRLHTKKSLLELSKRLEQEKEQRSEFVISNKSKAEKKDNVFYTLIFKWLECHKFSDDKKKDAAERKRAETIIKNRLSSLFIVTINDIDESMLYNILDELVRNHADAAQRCRRYFYHFYVYLYQCGVISSDISQYLGTLQISTKFKKVISKR